MSTNDITANRIFRYGLGPKEFSDGVAVAKHEIGDCIVADIQIPETILNASIGKPITDVINVPLTRERYKSGQKIIQAYWDDVTELSFFEIEKAAGDGNRVKRPPLTDHQNLSFALDYNVGSGSLWMDGFTLAYTPPNPDDQMVLIGIITPARFPDTFLSACIGRPASQVTRCGLVELFWSEDALVEEAFWDHVAHGTVIKIGRALTD